MAKIDLTSKDWCELIFKDRNKEYGAYDMRLDTPKRHNLATLIVIVVVILVITLPMLIKFITPEKENKFPGTKRPARFHCQGCSVKSCPPRSAAKSAAETRSDRT